MELISNILGGLALLGVGLLAAIALWMRNAKIKPRDLDDKIKEKLAGIRGAVGEPPPQRTDPSYEALVVDLAKARATIAAQRKVIEQHMVELAKARGELAPPAPPAGLPPGILPN